MKSISLFLAACGLGLSLSAPVAAQDIAIRAGKVITMAGQTIKDGVVLIRDGRIVAVGPHAKVKVPAAVKVKEFKNSVVMPGLIHPNTWRGMGRYRNENNPVLPFISTADGIDPKDDDFLNAIRFGYTTMHVIPFHDCVLGGSGLVIRPNAPSIAAMTVADPRIQKISLTKRGMGRIMAIHSLETAFAKMAWELKKDTIKVKDDKEEAKAKGDKYKPAKAKSLPLEKRDLAALVKGKGKAFFYCDNGSDLSYAISFARKHKIDMVPVLSNNCWKYLGLLKRAKLQAILASGVEFTYTDPVTEKKRIICPAAMLEKAGVPFAFTTTVTSDQLQNNPFYGAAVAIRNGVSRKTALSALTTVPAKMLGLEKRLGSLEKGKDGNLLVLSGDPFDTLTLVERVVIDGKLAYSRQTDPVLKNVITREKDRARKAAELKKKAAEKKAAAKKKATEKKKANPAKKPAKRPMKKNVRGGVK